MLCNDGIEGKRSIREVAKEKGIESSNLRLWLVFMVRYGKGFEAEKSTAIFGIIQAPGFRNSPERNIYLYVQPVFGSIYEWIAYQAGERPMN